VYPEGTQEPSLDDPVEPPELPDDPPELPDDPPELPDDPPELPEEPESLPKMLLLELSEIELMEFIMLSQPDLFDAIPATTRTSAAAIEINPISLGALLGRGCEFQVVVSKAYAPTPVEVSVGVHEGAASTCEPHAGQKLPTFKFP